MKGNNPGIESGFGNTKGSNASILRYVVVALVLGITIAAIANAGNVIVKNGQLNVSNDLLVDGNVLFVDSVNDRGGI